MIKTAVFAAVLTLAASLPTQAETLTLPTPPGAEGNFPLQGSRQAEVLRSFGEPTRRHPPISGHNARQPPITRWDYPGYSVFFERNTVIDVVRRDVPMPLQHTDGLITAP